MITIFTTTQNFCVGISLLRYKIFKHLWGEEGWGRRRESRG